MVEIKFTCSCCGKTETFREHFKNAGKYNHGYVSAEDFLYQDDGFRRWYGKSPLEGLICEQCRIDFKGVFGIADRSAREAYKEKFNELMANIRIRRHFSSQAPSEGCGGK